MQRLDEARPDQVEMFAAFGFACRCAQELESLLLSNLQYSLALAGEFSSLDEVDRSAEQRESIPMGQVFKQLGEFLDDRNLETQIGQALSTRNALVHHFFRKRTAGVEMTQAETADAIAWCQAACKEFGEVSRKLDERWRAQISLVTRVPDAVVPVMRDRMKAIELGKWPK